MSRPRWLTIALLVLASPATGAGGQDAPAAGTRPIIAVMNFSNASIKDHDLYEPFTVGVAGMLLTEMRENRAIELVERHRLREVLAEIQLGQSGDVDPATAARVGKILGAQHMIFGTFIIDLRGRLRIDARAVNVETSLVEHVESVNDDEDNLLRAVQKLGRQLNAGLKLPGRAAEPRESRSSRQGQVLADLKFARALQEEERSNPARAAELYREYLVDSPVDYAPVQRQEAETRIRFITTGKSSP
ncbi:MAG TPA: CsgG/HfaB family protein [Gemmatimonadaceae bacterium]